MASQMQQHKFRPRSLKMDIKPYKQSRNRHEIRLDSSTECMVLADGLSNAEYELTPGTIDRVGSITQLAFKFTNLANSQDFPQSIVVPGKRLALIADGLSRKFTVLNEPRLINDPVYSEVGDDAATIVSSYLEARILNSNPAV